MRLLITALIFLAVSIPAQASHRHHYRHRSVHTHHAEHRHSVRRHHAARHHSARHATVKSGLSKGAAVQHRQPDQGTVHHGGGMVTVQTAAGRITVASHLAERFKALIADFVAAGYKPRSIGCLAHSGHVENSRHYAGAACDFDQRGWGQTVKFMYHATAIIKKHGFRDGCSFNDCGHVDDGLPLHGSRRAQSWFGDDDDG